MTSPETKSRFRPLDWFLHSDYSMLIVLVVLCVAISLSTITRVHPEGTEAGEEVAEVIASAESKPAAVLILASKGESGSAFSEGAKQVLAEAKLNVVGTVQGEPRDARIEIKRLADAGQSVDVVACDHAVNNWDMWKNVPSMGGINRVSPKSYLWPSFLTTSNLLNVSDGVTVIAIIAIGMTMVIITAGIDLSVGSQIALSAVVAALIVQSSGGADASAGVVVLGFAAGILICGLVGLFNGSVVTAFGIPPFIATLATMSIASGLAFIFAGGESIRKVPDSFEWLGTGKVLSIPNPVILMVVLYAAAHFLMTSTPLGRYIYAVGGNREAARLSGVPVKKVLLFVYGLVGLLAGLAGVVQASRLDGGSPRYGQMLELEVIAAVVVGGTSLAGGEGKIFGTLIGAFIIAVIGNAMNLTNVESYTQKVVLGAVILGAVLLDQAKKKASARLRTA